MILCVWGNTALAQTVIKSIEYSRSGNSEYITLNTSHPVGDKKIFSLDNPDRLVLDINRVDNKTVTLPAIPKDSVMSAMRFGQFSPVTSRIVMDLKDKVKQTHIHQFAAKNSEPHKFMLEIVRDKPFSRSVEVSDTTLKDALPVPESKPFFAPSQAHKPLIVIDAGHGGKDPGAIGQSGMHEKHITLTYATLLQAALLRTGDYNVALTRSTDDYVFLHERVKMAREAGGDLFISLHADSAEEDFARGLSVYTVSEEASDREAALLAQGENAADEIGGLKFADDYPDIADILIDLASRDSRIKSNEFAGLIVQKMRAQQVYMLRNPNRFAGFRVLKAPDVPSVLVEIGFLSNTHDEQMLQDNSHRSAIIRALVDAVDGYFSHHPKDES